MENQELKTTIENILKRVLPPSAYIEVALRNSLFSGEYIKIMFASIDYNINGVRGQRPDVVSLNLNIADMELTTQIFGGNGGGSIYLKPDMANIKEKFLAMKSTKVPFRRPKPTIDAVLAAVERFAKAWLETMRQNFDRLRHHDIIDYKAFLSM